MQVEEPVDDEEPSGQGVQDTEALAEAYVLAGQEKQVVDDEEEEEGIAEGFTRLMRLFDAVTISASVSNVSQITTLEKAKSLLP